MYYAPSPANSSADQWLIYENYEDEIIMQEYLAELSKEINVSRGQPILISDPSLETIIRRFT